MSFPDTNPDCTISILGSRTHEEFLSSLFPRKRESTMSRRDRPSYATVAWLRLNTVAFPRRLTAPGFAAGTRWKVEEASGIG